MNKFFFVFFVLLSAHSFSQELVKVNSPDEVKVEVVNNNGLPKELEGLAWNRWTSDNFVVCSLDDVQAEYLNEHLESIKTWIYKRWGLKDINFSSPCKLICVNKKDIFTKLFNLDNTKVEIRRDSEGNVTESIIFLLINGPPSKTVPGPLTEVCLAEFSQKFNEDIPVCFYKAMSELNKSLVQIRKNILEVKSFLEKNEPMYFSESMLIMTKENYDKLSTDKKKLFDNCSMLFLLMIRKEFGQDAFLNFLEKTTKSSLDNSLSTLGFKSYDDFDKSFKRFLLDITNDISLDKLPDSYLQIKEKN